MASVTGQAQGSPSAHSDARSAPLKASTMPAISFAADRSTPVMCACAKGLRTMPAHSIPGIVMSSMKRASPVMSAGSSLRGTPWPTYLSATSASIVSAISPPPSGRRAGVHFLGCRSNRLDNVVVSGAPAEIAFEAQANILVGEFAVVLNQAQGGHDHSRGAVATLKRVVVVEGLLEGVQLPIVDKSLDGGNLG